MNQENPDTVTVQRAQTRKAKYGDGVVRCGSCHEQVQPEADICPYCQSNFLAKTGGLRGVIKGFGAFVALALGLIFGLGGIAYVLVSFGALVSGSLVTGITQLVASAVMAVIGYALLVWFVEVDLEYTEVVDKSSD